MPPAVPDTSFVFSFYGADTHTAAARAYVAKAGRPLGWTALQQYEFSNAVRFAVFRKSLTAADAALIFETYKADLRAGFVQIVSCDWDEVWVEAGRLSAVHTSGGGHRSFDVLHVATARVLQTREFLTFDANQRRLAKAVGLAVGP